MIIRVWIVLLTLPLAARLGCGQSIVKTVLGGVENGIKAQAATLYNPAAVISDGNGNVYVAVSGSGQVLRVDANDVVWLVAGNGGTGSTGDGGPATAATLTIPVGLALDPAGNLYIADSQVNRVRRVGIDGTISTYAGNGKAGYTGDGGPAVNASLQTPWAIACDAQGNLYIADTGNNVVRLVTLDGNIGTFAGTGIQGSSGNGGPAASARLNGPKGVTVDGRRVYISDTGNNWVRVVTPDGNISRYAGYDSTSTSSSPFGSISDPTIATNYTLPLPAGLAVDPAHNLYIAEPNSPRVLRVTTNGKIANYAGTGSGGGSGDEGLARLANIYARGIGINRDGNLMIADGRSNRVRVVTAADGIIRTFAGSGLVPFTPSGLAVSGNYLYFSDYPNNCVRRMDLTSSATALVAGTTQGMYSGDGDSAITAGLSGPRGIAVSSSGVLYIADSRDNRVRAVATDGTISTVVGNGTTGATADGGQATDTTLHEPVAVVVDGSGNLYIAERSGNTVRKVASGIISTVAGTGVAGAPDAETGIAVSQKLNSPQGLALGSSGDLYIADTGNHRVRRLSANGTITTIAGTGVAGSSGDSGPATAATLDSPAGVAFDSAGNLYITDANTHAVRRVATDGTIETVAGNGTAGYNGDGSPATAFSLNAPSAILAGSGCSMYIADSANQRVRQLWSAISYTINTNPPGLNVLVDGQAAGTPLVASLLPGTHHQVDAPAVQPGPSGVQYLSTGAQAFDVSCGPGRASLTVNLQVQYAITISTSPGGSVTPAAGWQNAGTSVTLTAVPLAGYVFAGWEGDCSGTGACTLVMDGPKNIKADFAPASALNRGLRR